MWPHCQCQALLPSPSPHTSTPPPPNLTAVLHHFFQKAPQGLQEFMEIVDFECVSLDFFFFVGGGGAAKNKTNKKKDDIRCVGLYFWRPSWSQKK